MLKRSLITYNWEKIETNVYRWKMDVIYLHGYILPNNKNECMNSLSSKQAVAKNHGSRLPFLQFRYHTVVKDTVTYSSSEEMVRGLGRCSAGKSACCTNLRV